MADNAVATADDDATPPGVGVNGDAISFYEEYRGFMIGGNHVRLNPNRKDVFVKDENGIGPGVFTSDRLGAPIHWIRANEWIPATHWMNFNTETAHVGDQYALKLLNGGPTPPPGQLPVQAAGMIQDLRKPWIPKNVDYCVIFSDTFFKLGSPLASDISASDTEIPVENIFSGYQGWTWSPRERGRIKIGDEIIEYSGWSWVESFFAVTQRGCDGTQAQAHPANSPVLYFAYPIEARNNIVAHELGHGVCMMNHTAPGCIMAPGLEVCTWLNNGYWDTFSPAALSQFRVK